MSKIYVPYLRTKQGELAAWQGLSALAKSASIPHIALASGTGAGLASDQLLKATNSIGDQRFILDISSGEGSDCADILNTMDETNNFRYWVELVRVNPAAIPIVQTPPTANRMAIKRQASSLMANHGKIALRLKLGHDDPIRRENVLIGLDNPSDCCFIIDLLDTSGRSSDKSLISLIARTYESIKEISPNSPVVLIGTNFPQSLVAHGRVNGSIPIEQLEIWKNFLETDLTYGDYAAIKQNFPEMQRRGPPQIAMPVGDNWFFERRERGRTPQYQDCALGLVGLAGWIPGVDTTPHYMALEEASRGLLNGKGSPGVWSKLRCGVHMESMARMMQSVRTSPGFAI